MSFFLRYAVSNPDFWMRWRIQTESNAAATLYLSHKRKKGSKIWHNFSYSASDSEKCELFYDLIVDQVIQPHIDFNNQSYQNNNNNNNNNNIIIIIYTVSTNYNLSCLENSDIFHIPLRTLHFDHTYNWKD